MLQEVNLIIFLTSHQISSNIISVAVFSHLNIYGFDINRQTLETAKENAIRAGVADKIEFARADIRDFAPKSEKGTVITNPPYGERIEEKKNLPALYKTIGERFKALDSWSMYLITAYEDAERYIGRKADKNRKIYNGMLKTYFYQFMGPRPPKRSQENRNVD